MKAGTLLSFALCYATAMAQSGQPERFKFQAYDGTGPVDPPVSMTFQINPLDSGGRTKFAKIGDIIEGTQWKVIKFEFKEIKTPAGDPEDVSELTVEHLQTKRAAILVLNKVTTIAR
jgi:hypothetical protein